MKAERRKQDADIRTLHGCTIRQRKKRRCFRRSTTYMDAQKPIAFCRRALCVFLLFSGPRVPLHTGKISGRISRGNGNKIISEYGSVFRLLLTYFLLEGTDDRDDKCKLFSR